MIQRAADVFELTASEMEILANKAGLSLSTHENALLEVRAHYEGMLKVLCGNAQISERMFRYYKTKEPTKQALQAIAVSLNFSVSEMDSILHKYGYCLSKSMAVDRVVEWYLTSKMERSSGPELLDEINETLYEMELPLLMTRPYADSK